ncbi:MAG: alpha/beta fold hydrolase [Thermoanaerobaculia bacterium]
MRNRVVRRLVIGALAVVGFFAGVEVLAWWNIARERAKRAYLGNLLYVETKGDGPPIVFLAGLQGSTRYWHGTFDSLAATNRLIAVDEFGFGRSPWPLYEPTLEDHLAWLRRTLEAQGATKHVTIVAHSFGAILAAYYAARYPDDVDRIVLLGAPIFRGPNDARSRIRDMSELSALFSLNPVVARETCLLMGAFRPLFRSLMPHMSSLPKEVAEDTVLHDWPSINGAIRNILLASPIEAALARVRSAVVFIQGSKDPVTPPERLREVASRIHAEVISVDGDHQGYVTSARDVVLDVLRRGAPQNLR